jgi:hypothetical protein
MTGVVNTGSAGAPPTVGLVLTATLGVATLADYVGWLGWDQTKFLGPDGSLHGPYEPWQVVGVVLVLGVIAATACVRRRPGVAVVVTTLVMTVCFSVQVATDPLNDGLWPIGAFMVAAGTCAGEQPLVGAAGVGGLAAIWARTSLFRGSGSSIGIWCRGGLRGGDRAGCC